MVTEDDVRRLALALPATTEKPAWGTPAFRVADKMFARIRPEDGGLLVAWCESLEDKEALIASDPRVYFTTAHYDGHASVLVRLSEVELDELREVLTDAWRVRAPKRVRTKLFPDDVG